MSTDKQCESKKAEFLLLDEEVEEKNPLLIWMRWHMELYNPLDKWKMRDCILLLLFNCYKDLFFQEKRLHGIWTKKWLCHSIHVVHLPAYKTRTSQKSLKKSDTYNTNAEAIESLFYLWSVCIHGHSSPVD